MRCLPFEYEEFFTPVGPDSLPVSKQLSALLKEALTTPGLNRARWSVSADELGIARRSIAVRLAPSLTGLTGSVVMHNPVILDASGEDFSVLERARSGVLQERVYKTSVSVDWFDDDGVFSNSQLTGVIAVAVQQAVGHLEETTFD